MLSMKGQPVEEKRYASCPNHLNVQQSFWGNVLWTVETKVEVNLTKIKLALNIKMNTNDIKIKIKRFYT